jgi:hypothetical protein
MRRAGCMKLLYYQYCSTRYTGLPRALRILSSGAASATGALGERSSPYAGARYSGESEASVKLFTCAKRLTQLRIRSYKGWVRTFSISCWVEQPRKQNQTGAGIRRASWGRLTAKKACPNGVSAASACKPDRHPCRICGLSGPTELVTSNTSA